MPSAPVFQDKKMRHILAFVGFGDRGRYLFQKGTSLIRQVSGNWTKLVGTRYLQTSQKIRHPLWTFPIQKLIIHYDIFLTNENVLYSVTFHNGWFARFESKMCQIGLWIFGFFFRFSIKFISRASYYVSYNHYKPIWLAQELLEDDPFQPFCEVWHSFINEHNS